MKLTVSPYRVTVGPKNSMQEKDFETIFEGNPLENYSFRNKSTNDIISFKKRKMKKIK